MASINKAIIIGRLTRDPETKTTPSGNTVCNLGVATNESWKDKQGQKQERVEYHKIVFWGNQAETIEKHFSKGQEIYVEGQIQTRSWDKDGEKRYTTEISGKTFEFIGEKQENTSPADFTTDDVPF